MRTSAWQRMRLTPILAWAICSAAAGQGVDAPQHLKSLGPAGPRSYLTDSWGVLGLTLSNPTPVDLEARALTFFADAPSRQYGRDLWVPGKATLWSWATIGPPPGPTQRSVVELKTLLYDRTGGQERLLKSPQGPPVHSELVRYHKREPGTTVLLDADIADGSIGPLSARDVARADEVRELVAVFRQVSQLSGRISSVKQRFLPPFPEALDGVDHFVIGSDRIADDVAGLRALREWLERGGTLWVMLDLVSPRTAAAILGDDLDLQVVDRVSLTHVQFRNGPGYQYRTEVEPLVVEEPIDFVRVLTPQQPPIYTIDGWPAAFLKDVGRGRILVTALGARGWTRPRTVRDRKSPFPEFSKLPVSLAPLDYLVAELHPTSDRPAVPTDDLRSFVNEQISYSVVGRNSVLVVFGLLFVVLTLAAFALGRGGRLEHLGWLGPALALGAAGVFIWLGALSRGAVPPTVAVAQMVDAIPGLDEAQATGFLAVYQPSLSTSAVGAERGGWFELDLTGLEGRALRRVQTDFDRWHWENLNLPAGVRTGPFRHTFLKGGAVEATVRFGPNGAEGRVIPGPFRDLEDVLLSTPGPHTVAVRLEADGTFRAGSDDELPSGQVMVGGLLSDRQRARQKLYEKLLAEPKPRYLAGRGVLLAWAEPVDMGFTLAADARTAGEALLTVPLQYERTPPNTRVTVPAAFLESRRITSDGRSLQVAAESHLATTMRLRFQVPASVRPLTVESARLTIKLIAPGRGVVLGGPGGGEASVLRRLTSPLGTEVVDLRDPALLRPDEHGAISFSVQIGPSPAGGGERNQWRLESAGLELRGRTAGEGEYESR